MRCRNLLLAGLFGFAWCSNSAPQYGQRTQSGGVQPRRRPGAQGTRASRAGSIYTSASLDESSVEGLRDRIVGGFLQYTDGSFMDNLISGYSEVTLSYAVSDLNERQRSLVGLWAISHPDRTNYLLKIGIPPKDPIILVGDVLNGRQQVRPDQIPALKHVLSRAKQYNHKALKTILDRLRVESLVALFKHYIYLNDIKAVEELPSSYLKPSHFEPLLKEFQHGVNEAFGKMLEPLYDQPECILFLNIAIDLKNYAAMVLIAHSYHNADQTMREVLAAPDLDTTAIRTALKNMPHMWLSYSGALSLAQRLTDIGESEKAKAAMVHAAYVAPQPHLPVVLAAAARMNGLTWMADANVVHHYGANWILAVAQARQLCAGQTRTAQSYEELGATMMMQHRATIADARVAAQHFGFNERLTF